MWHFSLAELESLQTGPHAESTVTAVDSAAADGGDLVVASAPVETKRWAVVATRRSGDGGFGAAVGPGFVAAGPGFVAVGPGFGAAGAVVGPGGAGDLLSRRRVRR